VTELAHIQKGEYQMIDLQKYCDPSRERIAIPFSAGEFTYATNGHILIRVPRRDDIAESSDAPTPNVEELFSANPMPPDAVPISDHKIPYLTLPKGYTETCDHCGGSGCKHDCPSCECDCETCNGVGEITVTADEVMQSVCIGTAIFNARYVRWILELPGLIVPKDVAGMRQFEPPAQPMPFKFDGGEGLLMMCRSTYEDHIGRLP